jgi:hypothetical protein
MYLEWLEHKSRDTRPTPTEVYRTVGARRGISALAIGYALGAMGYYPLEKGEQLMPGPGPLPDRRTLLPLARRMERFAQRKAGPAGAAA